MKKILGFFIGLCITSLAFSQAISEGATISFKLSGKYFVPKTNYTISGETQIGKKPVSVKVEILSGNNSIDNFEIPVDTRGIFKANKIAPEKNGKYSVRITGADGKKSNSIEFTVGNPAELKALLAQQLKASLMLAFKGLDAANNKVKTLTPSTSRDEFKDKYIETRKGLDEAASKLMEANKDFSKLLELSAQYPPVLEQAESYLEKIEAVNADMSQADKNFEQQLKQSEQQAAICDQLNFLSEAAGFVSLVLDFQGKLAKIFINIASDKLMPGALDRMDMSGSGKTGQSLENAKFEINSAQKALTASALGFNEFKDFAKQGFVLDFLQFCAKALYGKFCEEIKGPFTGTFRAEFDADMTSGMWNSYDMAYKGQLILRYEKGSNAKTGFAVTGEFEGVYTKYDFWEDFEKVEKLPKNLVLLMRKKIIAKPIDLSTISIPSLGKDPNNPGKVKVGTSNLDINNDVGMIARQLLPGSFRIKVKGTVKDDKISFKVDEGALSNQTNVGQNNKLIVVAASPIVPVPLVKVFEFPMAPAKSVFAVGIGEGEELLLKTSGGQTIAKKKIDKSRKLSNGDIRLRTIMDITVGSN